MTSTQNITISGVTMTLGAARNVEMTGTNVAADVERVRSGEDDFDTLLAECLDGLTPGEDATTMQHWLEYVEAVVAAAEVPAVSDAIHTSAMENRIVRIAHSDEARIALEAICDGSTRENDGSTDFWGVNAVGDEWRVRLSPRV